MILVVDDDKVLTRMLRKMIEDVGLEVVVANNGEEAYEKVKDPSCRCMLLDMRMPGINGAELLMVMTAEKIDVPVIVMAAFPDYEEDELKQFPNVQRLFQKPFYPEELLSAIQSIIGAKKV